MKKLYITTAVIVIAAVIISFVFYNLFKPKEPDNVIKVGFVFVGDESHTYTLNFINGMSSLKESFGDKVELHPVYNVHKQNQEEAVDALVNKGCTLIFANSYDYRMNTKVCAEKYPEVQFCQIGSVNANEPPVYPNYHTFTGKIHQGCYISGVVAGLKMNELIERNQLKSSEAKIGYVAAYPYSEVISGYTAFFLGVKSVVKEATMEVIYTNSWNNYALELKAAKRLIADKCVIMANQTDTKAVADACENMPTYMNVFYVGYNQNMVDIAPTTYLIGCRTNWSKYMIGAVKALQKGKKIENVVDGNVNGNDIGAGFDKGWIEMFAANEMTGAKGTNEKIRQLIQDLSKGKIIVFQGNYIGVSPFDKEDIYDLNTPYEESEYTSAATFHYELKNVIRIVDRY